MIHYYLDDLIYFIGKNSARRLCRSLHNMALIVFLAFNAIYIGPAIFKLKRARDIIRSYNTSKQKSDILSAKIRQELSMYLKKQEEINRFLSISQLNAPNHVFEKILTLLNDAQINNVTLKIGQIKNKKQAGEITLLLVPVRIKAYIEYTKLKTFFNALNKSTIYTLDRMQIVWSEKNQNDLVEIDMTVILKYKKEKGQIETL